jgi:hypothetical protein
MISWCVYECVCLQAELLNIMNSNNSWNQEMLEENFSLFQRDTCFMKMITSILSIVQRHLGPLNFFFNGTWYFYSRKRYKADQHGSDDSKLSSSWRNVRVTYKIDLRSATELSQFGEAVVQEA